MKKNSLVESKGLNEKYIEAEIKVTYIRIEHAFGRNLIYKFEYIDKIAQFFIRIGPFV